MEPTKEILELLEKRRKAGEDANAYESQVNSWCEKHGVDVKDIFYGNGCMLITEPGTYEQLYLERIRETGKNIKK